MKNSRSLELHLGYGFLLLIVATLAAAYFSFSVVIDIIEEERLKTQDFMINWLTFEDLSVNIYLFYQPENKAALIPLDLAEKLGKFDADLHALQESKVIKALELTNQYPHGDTLRLESLWAEIFRSFQARLDGEKAISHPSTVDRQPSSQEIYFATNEFKQLLLARIAAINTASLHQRRALSMVAVFSVIALIASLSLALFQALRLGRSRDQEAHAHELLQTTMGAQEQERTRIAMELHDTIAQELVAASMAVSQISPDQDGLKDSLGRQLETCIEHIRQLSSDLYPADFAQLGLQRSLKQLVEAFQNRTRLAVVMEETGTSNFLGLPPEKGIHLFRIIQEAFTNIERHAKATAVTLLLDCTAEAIIVKIRDNGSGFHPGAIDRSRKHFGLRNMQERAALLGGTMRIEASTGKGTSLCIEVPHV